MRILWNRKTRNLCIKIMQALPIQQGRVMCVCWGGEQYDCSPRAIVEKMAEMALTHGAGKKFEVSFAFFHPENFLTDLPIGVEAVTIGSYQYFKRLSTAQFIISNTRFGGGMFWPMPKRKGQYYIQTMHGGHGIKHVEFDVDLPEAYLKLVDEDAKRTDIMPSESDYQNRLFRSAYHYYGDVLNTGLPRNDIFFRPAPDKLHKQKSYVIYTPTFRSNGRRDVFGFDTDRVVGALEQRFGGEWYVMISSHPNMRSYYHELYDFSHPRLIDVGREDLHPLLRMSEALITDYSSAEMDFSLMNRPVFQLCKDRADYDRGFYIKPEELPFPYAETDDQLVNNILSFDAEKYAVDLENFNRERIGLHETGHASEDMIRWMLDRR